MTFPETPETQIAELKHLRHARLSAFDYYRPLLESSDEVLYVGAWNAALTTAGLARKKFAGAVRASRFGAVRRTAFAYFERVLEHDLSEQVLSVSQEDIESSELNAMRASLSGDMTALLLAETNLFLTTGRITQTTSVNPIDDLGSIAERSGGWRARLPWSVRNVLLAPHEPSAVFGLLMLLYTANQDRFIDDVIAILNESDLHPFIAAVFSAASAYLKKDLAEARRLVEASKTARQSRADMMTIGRTLSLRILGSVLDEQKDFRGAYAAFEEFNKLTRDGKIDLAKFGTATRARGNTVIPRLPPDDRTSDFMMLGFPRSGTTLLENALAAHPAIETFEEQPTLSAATSALEIASAGGSLLSIEDFVVARGRYYSEIDRRRQKRDARILVDKMPMRSAEARFLVKLLPDKRYLFSVRHPFDVVLSCFRQHFEPNAAMVHFHTIADASRLYDFTMSQWFSVFGLNDSRVKYVRYDELVEKFEPTLRETLNFIGADWDNAVQSFARAAEERLNRTPSYQKVRQGLSIGVQTYWRNYKFVFDSPDAKPLHKWAEFFGYPTK